jgi:hypothetical protein
VASVLDALVGAVVKELEEWGVAVEYA